MKKLFLLLIPITTIFICVIFVVFTATFNVINTSAFLCAVESVGKNQLNKTINKILSSEKNELPPSFYLDKERKEIVKKIEDYGNSKQYPETVIIATIDAAFTESHLTNVAHGDRDSVGLFQMRPSQGWGTFGEILNLDYSIPLMMNKLYWLYSSSPFYFTQNPDILIQDVEKSKFPEKYAENFKLAGKIHGDFLKNKESNNNPLDDIKKNGFFNGFKDWVSINFYKLELQVIYSVIKTIDNTNLSFCNYLDNSKIENENSINNQLNSQDQSLIQKNLGKIFDIYTYKPVGWYNRCLAFVEEVYDVHKTYLTALGLYNTIDTNLKHPPETPPIAGALLFFQTNNPAGHVAIALNADSLITTDIPVKDRLGFSSIKILEEKYGFHYLGWTSPVFP